MKENRSLLSFYRWSYLSPKIAYLLVCPLLFVGCKKSGYSKIEDEIVSPTTGTRTEFTLDSIYLYAKQVYLWNDVLPEYQVFLPREKYKNYSLDIFAFKKEIFDISQIKINPATGKPYEFLNDQTPKYSNLQLGLVSSSISNAGSSAGEMEITKNIIINGDKKIAYVSINSFPSLSKSKSKLDIVFNEFGVEQPSYLVIDLRSNSGGYVETAEYIANLIAPTKLNGQIIYSEQFNNNLQLSKASILKHQPYLDENGKTVIYNGRNATLADVDYTEAGNTYRFQKKGNLETIRSVYFIVSGNTASASELLISCLKPYFDVKLVGEKTYGKPVGFFGIDIHQYSVYLSSFLLKNADGWFDYFNGIDPDIPVVVPQNSTLGDPNESCLKATIASINNIGNGKTATTKIAVNPKGRSQSSSTIPKSLPQINYGAIENRLKLKHKSTL